MVVFRCSITFRSDRDFDYISEELSYRYLGGLRLIPADRRLTREFTREACSEYPLFSHDLELVWDEDDGVYRLYLHECENEQLSSYLSDHLDRKHGSFERCLGVLLRQIDGVHDICINSHTAGPYLDVWQAKVPLYSRRTIQEIGALLAQKLFCGFRFVPADGATMRVAQSFQTESELLGHQVRLGFGSEQGQYELSIDPSPSFLKLLMPHEHDILRLIDIQEWVKGQFRTYTWIRPGNAEEESRGEA